MTKLTPTQRRLLETAASRKDNALLPPPEGLRLAGSALEASLASLARRGLVAGAPEDPAGYRLTPAGLALAKAGASKPARTTRRAKTATGLVKPALKSSTPPDNKSPSAPALAGKLADIAKLLAAPAGADLATLTAATGWQAHSVRAALTGLRKRGFAVTRERDVDGASRYRVDPEV